MVVVTDDLVMICVTSSIAVKSLEQMEAPHAYARRWPSMFQTCNVPRKTPLS